MPSYSFNLIATLISLALSISIEFVSIRNFEGYITVHESTENENALETRSTSFNSLQKVTDTKMHLM